MNLADPRPQPRLQGLAAAALAIALCACASPSRECAPPFLAVLSAFPAELAPLVERARIEETLTIDGRVFRKGTLAGVPVVLALTGIGMRSASSAAQAVLEHFPVEGIVFSGVAGSRLRIGDVAVPAAWTDERDAVHSVHRSWLDLAVAIAARGDVPLEHCTLVPDAESEPEVCLPHQPVIAVGGVGRSRDPYDIEPFPCQPEGGDVFGCDVGARGTTPAWMKGGVDEPGDPEEPELAEAGGPIVGDMETAAVAREAAARGVPLIAFRAASDGKGDPLELTRAFAQFFVYYRLAGRNAANATVAFLEQLAAAGSCAG